VAKWRTIVGDAAHGLPGHSGRRSEPLPLVVGRPCRRDSRLTATYFGIYSVRHRIDAEQGPLMLFLDPLRKLRQRHPAPSLKPTTYYVPVVPACRVCPECAGPLIRSSGCIGCVYCGWGRCG
jgi:hypothetical protein